jgi:hypothetical protein
MDLCEPLPLAGWSLLSDGIHTFKESDTVFDYFALPESLWDDGFDLPEDSGELSLLDPQGGVYHTWIWSDWPNSSKSANLFYTFPLLSIHKYFGVPTPGERNDTTFMGLPEYPFEKPIFVSILSNYPEPFNDRTTISYSLVIGAGKGEMGVYDIIGRTLFSEKLNDLRPGYHELTVSGLPSSGIYFVRIKTDIGSAIRRITYAK